MSELKGLIRNCLEINLIFGFYFKEGYYGKYKGFKVWCSSDVVKCGILLFEIIYCVWI